MFGRGSGDTIFYFLNHFKNKFERIYCFEPEIVERVKYNTSILQGDIKDKIIYREHYAGNCKNDNGVRLEELFEKTKVSIISMDIEGAEIEALYGAANMIREQKPVLAISAYHKWDDLIKFVQYLSDVKEYKFYLRKYAALHSRNRNETVLYAVPENRISKVIDTTEE